MEITERNLQEIGKSLLVSLPKKWTESYNLKKGSKIKIINTEKGLLTIAPEFTRQVKESETQLDFDEYFERKFYREYFNGNEKITINFKSKIPEKERKRIYDFIKRFISIQIIEDSQSKIVLKSFKIEELSIEECLKRLYFLSLGMLEELSSSNDKMIMAEIRDNMTRFYYLLVMQIRRFLDEGKFTKENQISLLRAMDFRMVAEKIQRIGEIVQNLEKIPVSHLNTMKKIHDLYSRSALAFINNNFDKAPALWKESSNLKKELSKSLEKNGGFFVKEISQILRYTAEISGLIR